MNTSKQQVKKIEIYNNGVWSTTWIDGTSTSISPGCGSDKYKQELIVKKINEIIKYLSKS